MTTKKSIWILLGILMTSVWIFGSAIQAGAETMNFKAYSYVVKSEAISIGDVEDHILGLETRRGFSLFENGEVGTGILFVMGDYIKGLGSNTSYGTITFSDGSTIMTKRQMTITASEGKPQLQADSKAKSSKGQDDLRELRGL